MSHDTPAVKFEDVAARVGTVDFKRGRIISAALVITGLACFALLLGTGHARQAWQSYLVNLVFFLGIAQAGIVWSAIARTNRGTKWASSLTRYGEAMSAFLPIGYALVAIFLFAGGSQLYPWVAEPIAAKAPWLNWPAFIARNLILMGALIFMSRVLLGKSLRPDLGRAKDLVPAKLREQYIKRTAGWKGDEAEAATAQKQLLDLSPWFIVLYCCTYTIWAFDVLMSLDPHWVSTLFGAFIFMSTLYTGLAGMSLVAIHTRKKLGLEQAVSTEQFHTLGKLLFAFALFWVYSYWSQFLPIWYANLSEETPYVVLRLKPPFEFWAWAVFVLTFLVPFAGLMNWTTKKNPALHQWFALIALIGVWLERNLIVLPSVNPAVWDLTLPQLGVMLGFLGAFVLPLLNFASRYPMLSSIGIPSGAPEDWKGTH
jgi:glycopeptide antibiotics resistance protein